MNLAICLLAQIRSRPKSLRVGAFERVTATQGIRSAYQAATGHAMDVPAIFAAAAEGDAAAQAVLDGVARQLARAVATLGAVIAPEVVILGGSIGARPEIIAATEAELARCFPFPIRIVAKPAGQPCRPERCRGHRPDGTAYGAFCAVRPGCGRNASRAQARPDPEGRRMTGHRRPDRPTAPPSGYCRSDGSAGARGASGLCHW